MVHLENNNILFNPTDGPEIFIVFIRMRFIVTTDKSRKTKIFVTMNNSTWSYISTTYEFSNNTDVGIGEIN